MSYIHIDDFYRDAGKTLATLYNHFPRPMTLLVEDIAGPDTPDEFGLHSTRHMACLHAFLWLADQGYLTYQQLVRQEAVDQAVLSHRGFLLLNATSQAHPSAPNLPPQETTLVIHRLSQELREGTSFSLAALMRELMAQSRRYSDQMVLLR